MQSANRLDRVRGGGERCPGVCVREWEGTESMVEALLASHVAGLEDYIYFVPGSRYLEIEARSYSPEGFITSAGNGRRTCGKMPEFVHGVSFTDFNFLNCKNILLFAFPCSDISFLYPTPITANTMSEKSILSSIPDFSERKMQSNILDMDLHKGIKKS